jgi:hypothetical protein
MGSENKDWRGKSQESGSRWALAGPDPKRTSGKLIKEGFNHFLSFFEICAKFLRRSTREKLYIY